MVLFRAFFTLVILDASVNGPQLENFRLPALLTFSALSIAVSFLHPLGWLAFVLAELLWIVAFLESSAIEKKRKAEEEEARLKKAALPTNTLPADCLEYVKEAKELFLKNLNDQTNQFGEPWRVLSEADGVKVMQSDIPKQKFKLWKIETEIVGEFEVLKKELLDYNVRVKWDTSVASGTVLKVFDKVDIGEPSITKFYTAPAGAGAVSSRELVDFGLEYETEEPKGLYFINCSIPPNLYRFPELPQKVTGVRGFNHKGSGLAFVNIPGTQSYKYTLVNAMDLGGWLPISVINSATTQALQSGTQEMIKHLKKLANVDQR